jgi:uncharacterized membrane protein YedE/YeeE
MAVLMQFVIGLIFSAGLILAGMTDPAKVQNFLDLAGQWDPSLMFVMIGAIAVTFVGYKLVLKRKAPIFGGKFHLPTRKDADSRLLVGSGLFGIGWGLAGLCPGPAVTSLGIGSAGIFVFVAALAVGMFAARKLPEPKG